MTNSSEKSPPKDYRYRGILERPDKYTFYFGALLTAAGSVTTFATKSKARVPKKHLEMGQGSFANGTEAIVEAEKLAAPYKEMFATKKIESGIGEITPGTVAIHDDGQRHMVIVLFVEKDGGPFEQENCWVLFFTGSPSWAPGTRRASKDEIAMSSYVSRKTTYLAPAIRPASELRSLSIKMSDHILSDLQKEFLPTFHQIHKGVEVG